MSAYLPLYYIHVITVCLSGAFFLVRGLWMIRENERLHLRFVRIAPHVNDAILLLAAVGLAVTTRQYPLTHDWLTVKVLALVIYILLGMFALRRGKTKATRVTCFALALLTFGFMVAVAMTRGPLGSFRLV